MDREPETDSANKEITTDFRKTLQPVHFKLIGDSGAPDPEDKSALDGKRKKIIEEIA